MDEAAQLADIASRQRMATSSDQGSDTKAPCSLAAKLESIRQRVLSQPEPKTCPIESPEAARARRAHQDAAAIAAVVRAAGPKYADAGLKTWVATVPRQKVVCDAVREYCESIDERVLVQEGVLLYGPVGTGKDHLAMGVAKAACLAGLSVKWLKGQEWFGSLRDSIDSDRSERDIFRSLECDVLVLSDPLPPVGPLTPYQASMLYRLTEDRYSRGGVIVATVNVASDEEADARMGAQTWDRLGDGAWKIHCDWPSFRKPARKV